MLLLWEPPERVRMGADSMSASSDDHAWVPVAQDPVHYGGVQFA